MSFQATFCDVPISAGFDAHAATSSVSLDWVINSGLRMYNSQVSGVLTLPCDVGVISMALNNLPVTASLPSDLLLGLDWFNYAQFSAPRVVHLDSGSLDIRRPSLLTVGITESGPPSSTPMLAVAPVSQGSTSVDSPSSSPPATLGGPGVVSTPSLMPPLQGVNVVAASTITVWAARTRGVQTSRPRAGQSTHDDDDDMMLLNETLSPPPLCLDDPFVSLTLNEKNSFVRSLIFDQRVTRAQG
ncbi:hypothetical protein B0H14DRAFT_2842054 [Mycena olivaceomarginata]|nr:hypothetical protein B0H14DRAFT_2842054 [Mycena olivaceomarginata]